MEAILPQFDECYTKVFIMVPPIAFFWEIKELSSFTRIMSGIPKEWILRLSWRVGRIWHERWFSGGVPNLDHEAWLYEMVMKTSVQFYYMPVFYLIWILIFSSTES